VLPQGQIAVTNVAPGSPAEEAGWTLATCWSRWTVTEWRWSFNDRFNEKKTIGASIAFTFCGETESEHNRSVGKKSR